MKWQRLNSQRILILHNFRNPIQSFPITSTESGADILLLSHIIGTFVVPSSCFKQSSNVITFRSPAFLLVLELRTTDNMINHLHSGCAFYPTIFETLPTKLLTNLHTTRQSSKFMFLGHDNRPRQRSQY